MSANNLYDRNDKYLFDKDAWGVATIGLLLTSMVVSVLLGIFFQSGLGKFTDGFTGFLLSTFLITIGALISFLLVKLLKPIPVFFKTTVGAVLFSLLIFILLRDDMHPGFLFFLVFFIIILQGILAGSIWVILSGRLRFVPYTARIWARVLVLGIILLDVGIYYLLAAANREDTVAFSARLDKKVKAQIPKEKVNANPLRISSFYYGSGNDYQRSTYQKGLSFNAESFDLGKILPQVTSYFDEKFEWFWGFNAQNIPLNAQVWLPEADSLQAELVLIIHGEAAQTSGLENGFGYLAETLASMGHMVVIPDLNFFNALWVNIPQKEKLWAQTVILQKHLEALQKWNSDAPHKLYNKVDTSGITTIIGHGEGASVARELINLSKTERLPYNANYTSNINFKFKKIVELAPAEAIEKKAIRVKDVAHLAILAGHNAASTSKGYHSFIHFTDTSKYYFSNIVRIHEANYAQFNETLAGRDLRPPFNWLINQGAIMSGKDQRELTTRLITIFLKCAAGQIQWLPVMQNTYYLEELPENLCLVNQFKDNRQLLLASFDEDSNPLTTTFEAAKITGKNVKIWSEIDYKSESTYGNKGLLLGWDASNLKNLSAAMRKDSTASFSILLNPNFNEIPQLTLNSVFYFSMAYLGKNVTHITLPYQDQNISHDQLNFSIEFIDSIGIVNRIAFKHFTTAVPAQKPKIFKIPWFDKKAQNLFPQSYTLTIDKFFTMNPNFDINTLEAINFVFDKSEKGKILIDDIGFRKQQPKISINEE